MNNDINQNNLNNNINMGNENGVTVVPNPEVATPSVTPVEQVVPVAPTSAPSVQPVMPEVNVAPTVEAPSVTPVEQTAPVAPAPSVSPNAPASMPVSETPSTVVTNTNPINENAQVQEPNANIEQPVNTFYEKDKKKWPIVVFVILLLLAGAFGYYYFVMTKPKTLVTKVVDAIFLKAKGYDVSSSLTTNEINSIKFDGSLTLTSSADEYSSVSGLTAKLGLGYDLKDSNKNKTDISVTLQNQTLVDFALSVVDDKTYFDFKKALSKVVYVKSSDDESSLSLDIPTPNEDEIKKNYDNTLYLIEKIKSTLVNNITDSKLSKKVAFSDIDGKKTPVNEITYKIDYAEYKKISTAIYNELMNDDKSLDALSGIVGADKETIKTMLKNKMDNISELDLDGDINVSLSIDALSNKLVKATIKDNSGVITYVKKSNESNITFDAKDEMNVKITIDEKENKVFADLKMIDGETVERMSVTLKVNNMDKTGMDISTSLILYDTQDVNKEVLSVVLQLNAEYNKEIESVNIANAVDIETLSPEETQKVNDVFMSLMGLFASFIPE